MSAGPEHVGARMSLEQIETAVTEIANDGDSAERLRALKLLAGMRAASGVILPPPLDDRERIERLGRLMRSVGTDLSRRAFGWAFKTRGDHVERPSMLGIEDLPDDIMRRAERLNTLPRVRREFPELVTGGGFPRGFPRRGTTVEKARWCIEQAQRGYLARIQAAAKRPEPLPEPDDVADVPEPLVTDVNLNPIED